MIGTFRINTIVAALAGLLTFALSIGNNLFLTTCLKSLYSFIIMFVLTFGFRWVWGMLIGLERSTGDTSKHNEKSDSHLGNSLDLVTPDEDEMTKEGPQHSSNANQAHAGTTEAQFSPLNPPKLVTKNQLDPEQLAGALRRMTED